MGRKDPGTPIRHALEPMIGLLDRSEKTPNRRPRPSEECTRFPEEPWDLRTIIMVFPEEAPFRFLNLNILLGLTGIPFDRTEQWNGSDPKDAFDLQFCLEGKERHATYKRYHSVARELSYSPDAVRFNLGERLTFEGSWPGYKILYRQPEEELSLSMDFDSWDGFHWWAYFAGIYCHYTSFSSCNMEWQWRGEAGKINLPALHDHGWGRNLLPIRLPVRVFRYEVLRLPEEGHAISLWTEGPLGLQIKNTGLIRRDLKNMILMKKYECSVMESDTFYNYKKQPCRVPAKWTGIQRNAGHVFEYEARRVTEPRPIIGNGFMYGFDYKGELSGPDNRQVEGQGYVEQMGLLL